MDPAPDQVECGLFARMTVNCIWNSNYFPFPLGENSPQS
jgi:hypothetical protein